MKGRTMNSAGILRAMLLRRKKNYWLLFTSILISTFLAGTMVILMASGWASAKEFHRLHYGAQDMILFSVQGRVDPQSLLQENLAEEYGVVTLHAHTMPDGNDTRDGFALAHYDDKAMELSARKLKTGRLPEAAGEIAVEATALRRSGFGEAQVGDTLTLTLASPDGREGLLAQTETRKYVLVGILGDQRPYLDEWGQSQVLYRDYPAAVVASSDPMAPGAVPVQNLLCVCEADYELGIYLYQKFGNAMAYEYTNFDNYSSNMMSAVMVVVYLGGILLVVCGFGVAAAFSTTIEERTRQLGLLRAVGATSRQIRNMLLGQTMLMTAVAIPAGLGLGIGVSWIVMRSLGEDYIFAIESWTIPAAIGFIFLCVAVVSALPLLKASRISPMQAIRDVEMQYAMKRGHIRSAKHFRPALHMAKRSLNLHKGQWFGAAALTLATVMIVGIGLPYGLNSLRNLNERMVTYDYQLYMRQSGTDYWQLNTDYPVACFDEADRIRLENTFAGQEFRYSREVGVWMQVDRMTDYAALSFDHPYLGKDIGVTDTKISQEVQQQYRNTLSYFGIQKEAVSVKALVVSDTDMFNEEKILEGAIHPDKIRSGEEIIVYAPYWAYRVHEDGNGVTSRTATNMEDLLNDKYGETFDSILENDMIHAGDEVTLTFLTTEQEELDFDANDDPILPENYTKHEVTVKVGAVVSSLCKGTSGSHIGILDIGTTDSALDAWGWEKPEYHAFYIRLNETPDEAVQAYYDSVCSDIEEMTSMSYYYNDIETNNERRETLCRSLATGAVVVLLFFACTAAMINRILSAQIRNSRRTIGMLRSVGAEKGTVFAMFSLQAVTVVGIGGLLSLVGCVTFCLWNMEYYPVGFMLGIGIAASLIYLSALIAVCLMHIRGRMDAIYRQSVTENIREL